MLFTSAASSDMNIPKGLAAIAATIITTIRTTNRIATPTQPKAAKNAAAAYEFKTNDRKFSLRIVIE